MNLPALLDFVAAPRAWAVACVLLASGCGNKNDDDRPPKPIEPPAPVTVAPIAAEPPAAEPAPAPTSGAAAPAAPARPGATSTAAPKKGPGQAAPPIPSGLVPKPLQPYVPKDLPKVPANLPGVP